MRTVNEGWLGLIQQFLKTKRTEHLFEFRHGPAGFARALRRKPARAVPLSLFTGQSGQADEAEV